MWPWLTSPEGEESFCCSRSAGPLQAGLGFGKTRRLMFPLRPRTPRPPRGLGGLLGARCGERRSAQTHQGRPGVCPGWGRPQGARVRGPGCRPAGSAPSVLRPQTQIAIPGGRVKRIRACPPRCALAREAKPQGRDTRPWQSGEGRGVIHNAKTTFPTLPSERIPGEPRRRVTGEAVCIVYTRRSCAVLFRGTEASGPPGPRHKGSCRAGVPAFFVHCTSSLRPHGFLGVTPPTTSRTRSSHVLHPRPAVRPSLLLPVRTDPRLP